MQARNRPHPRAALLVAAALVLLAVLAARVDAAPAPGAAAEALDPAPASGDDMESGPELGGREGDELRDPPDALVDPALVATASRHAPSLHAAIAMAYRAAGLDNDPAPGFARRARLAALVPTVAVRVGQNDTWRDEIDPTVGHAVVFDVRASWRLDRLAFDPSELRASMIEVARRRDRRRVALAVDRAYFAWLRATAAGARVPAWALRADEAAAALDALTDGAWSRR